jgi:lipopolysaccharide transport system permease protein
MESNRSFEHIIQAGKSEKNYWKDVLRYKELFYVLAWRDISVRYKQTVFGVLWAVLRPVITMIIFVVVFGKIAQLPSEGVPYPVFVFAALLPWTFFSTAFSDASESLIANTSLVSKVYFPRVIIPASAIIVAVVDFLIAMCILFLLMVFYQYWPSWQMLLMPLFLIMGFFSAFGLGLFISALNVKFRDFRFLVPFIVQLGLYISPVGFSSSIVPEKFQLLYYLNPMAAVIDGFRWCISAGQTSLNIEHVMVSVSVIITMCFAGFFYFRKTEKTFADII